MNKLESFYFPRENIQGVGRLGEELVYTYEKALTKEKICISEFSVSRNPHCPNIVTSQYKNKSKTPVLVNTAFVAN